MRLIDVDELKKAIENYLAEIGEVFIYEAEILSLLDNAPTVAESIVIDKINADTGEITYHRADMRGKE